MEIGIAAYAIEHANAAFAGVLLGLMSAGSAAAGLAYGSRSWHFPLARQFAATLALTALGLGLLSLRWDGWVFAALSVLAPPHSAPARLARLWLRRAHASS